MQSQKMTSVRTYISELNGYLKAISDLNDQVGFRHGYTASHKLKNGRSAEEVIRDTFGQEALSNLSKSSLNIESELIRRYALCNAGGAKSLDGVDRKPKLTETIVWQIQDYLSIDDYFGEKISERWTTHFHQGKNHYEAILLSSSKYLISAVFSTRKEEIQQNA